MSTGYVCTPTACGSCPMSGLCGDPSDLPPEVFPDGTVQTSIFDALDAPEPVHPDAPDVDPAEPAPEGGCCGGGCCS